MHTRAPKLPLADAAALIARAISYEAAGDAAAYADAIRALDEGRGRYIDGQWWGGAERFECPWGKLCETLGKCI